MTCETIEVANAFQRNHDAGRPRSDCGLAADLFSQLSVLFNRRSHQRQRWIVLIEFEIFKLF